MKLFLKPPNHLANDGSVIQIACLENLYKIFERCWDLIHCAVWTANVWRCPSTSCSAVHFFQLSCWSTASPQEFWNIFFQDANGISNCQASMNFFWFVHHLGQFSIQGIWEVPEALWSFDQKPFSFMSMSSIPCSQSSTGIRIMQSHLINSRVNL